MHGSVWSFSWITFWHFLTFWSSVPQLQMQTAALEGDVFDLSASNLAMNLQIQFGKHKPYKGWNPT